MEPRSRSFQALGPGGFNRVRYWEWGSETAERTALCVHGLTRNGRDFDDLAAGLAARGWRVAAVTLSGGAKATGCSTKRQYDFATYVQDMALLVARLGGGPVDWIGTSMGGIMGQMFAAGASAPVRKLVLNDIGPFLDKAGLVRIKGYVGKDPSYDDFDAAKAAIDAVTDKFGPMDDAQRRRFVSVAIRERANGKIAMNYDPAIAWSFRETEPADVDLWMLWNFIQCPTLIIRGGESDLLSAETAARMKTTGPKAEEFVVDGVGHAPALMSQPEIDRIAAFLEA